MRPAVVLLVLVAVLVGAPRAAHAATVSVVTGDSCEGDVACSKYAGGTPYPIVVYEAAAGEVNRVEARREGDVVRLRDPVAVLTAAAPCRVDNDHAITCPAGGTAGPGFVVRLGDGDDELTIAGTLGTRTRIDGGPGADRITGGSDPDAIEGGEGDDTLEGGAADDLLDYSRRTAPVVVDLDARTGGQAGERDTVGGFERVVGGSGSDDLAGSSGPDSLDGAAGDDAIAGGAGTDILSGGVGTDAISGGSGADVLSGDPAQGDDYYTPTIDPSPDVLDGGTGDDRLRDPAGGGDHLRGGVGNDVLSVDGPGAARLAGGAGRDTLSGGDGRDAFDGGTGNDRILSRDGRSERVQCGRGRDVVDADRADRLRRCDRRRRLAVPD